MIDDSKTEVTVRWSLNHQSSIINQQCREAAMNHQKAKFVRRLRRSRHVRRKITGTPERPRLSVYRSSKHIYAQLIDDLAGVTLASAASTVADVRQGLPNGGNVKAAVLVGKKLAEVARE